MYSTYTRFLWNIQQKRRIVQNDGGHGSYMAGIICPLGPNRVNWYPKTWGGTCSPGPPTSAVSVQTSIIRYAKTYQARLWACGRGDVSTPSFGSQLNPISTRGGGRLCPSYTGVHTKFWRPQARLHMHLIKTSVCTTCLTFYFLLLQSTLFRKSFDKPLRHVNY